MVSALLCGSSGPLSSSGRAPCVVLLGKTLHFHSAFLHPGVYIVEKLGKITRASKTHGKLRRSPRNFLIK